MIDIIKKLILAEYNKYDIQLTKKLGVVKYTAK